MGMFLIVAAYTLRRHPWELTQGFATTNAIPNLVVNTTCARRVETVNVKRGYHTVLLHLFSGRREAETQRARQLQFAPLGYDHHASILSKNPMACGIG